MRNVRLLSRGLSLKGRSTDPGCSKVARVYVSVAKVRGRHGCRFLGHDGRLHGMSGCRRPTLFRLRGTTHWHRTLQAALPHGIYRMVVRAYDAAGNKERPAAGRNIVRFRIR
jgi:hypothetical protein